MTKYMDEEKSLKSWIQITEKKPELPGNMYLFKKMTFNFDKTRWDRNGPVTNPKFPIHFSPWLLIVQIQ